MAATYRAVMATKKGGPEVLRIVELPVEPPGPGQLRVRVRAAGVGATDLVLLAGKYRYYRAGPIDRLTRALQPQGVDYVFDAVGGANIGPCIGALRRGGTLVGAVGQTIVVCGLPLPSRGRGRRQETIVCSTKQNPHSA
jgi:NADPH2:quinone reductase